MEDQAYKVPFEEQKERALKEYNEMALRVGQWSGFVEEAIKAYTEPMGNKTDSEVKDLAGHPSLVPQAYRYWFLTGYRYHEQFEKSLKIVKPTIDLWTEVEELLNWSSDPITDLKEKFTITKK